MNAITVHARDNTPAMQNHLDQYRAQFARKCLETYKRLMTGEQLTVLGAANSGISSLPRRIADLKEQGVQLDWYWEGSRKVYLMRESDRVANALRFPDLP